MKLKQQKAKVYQRAFANNLTLSGVENGEPVFLGLGTDVEKWKKELNK